jgi:hypothetical protein
MAKVKKTVLGPAFFRKIGSKGGLSTFKKKGSKHFAGLAKRRKTFAGGRPRKDVTTSSTTANH